MTALIRDKIAPALKQVRQPHPGLLLQRGLAEHHPNDAGRAKGRVIEQVCQQAPSTLYRLAYQRWQDITADTGRYRRLYARLTQRLFIGQSAANAMETGVSASHSYGMPLVPGSAAKGCARDYARRIGVATAYLAALFGEGEPAAALTSPTRGAGSLVWHDAWWNPDSAEPPYTKEIITTHHQGYYAGKGRASDLDKPIPNAQIAVQGGFCFVIEGPPAWADLAVRLLTAALAETGVGAKRAAGYGIMEPDGAAQAKARAAQNKVLESTLSARERVAARLAALNEEQLARRYGTECAATRQGYTQEEWDLVPEVARELFAPLLEAWGRETRKSHKARYKARRFFLGEGREGEDG